MAPPITFRYTRMPYCTLCGELFSSDSDFRAVIYVEPRNELFMTEPANFVHKHAILRFEDPDFEIHDANKGLKTFQLAPSVHSLCWTAMNNPPDLSSVYMYGLLMSPFLWHDLPPRIYSRCPIVARKGVSSFPLPLAERKAITHTSSTYMVSADSGPGNDDGSKLRTLLDNMKNLPQEIIDMIWELIPPCAIRRLLSSRVIEEFWPTMHPTPGSTVVQMCSGNIIIYSTYVLDGFYISGIRIDDKLYGYQNDDTPLTLTIPSPLAALLVTYGQYGMRTIEVLSEPTECLPKSSNTKTQEFLSIIHPRSQPFRVQLTWDAMKITSFIYNPEIGDGRQFGDNFHWLSPWPRNPNNTLSATSFYDHPPSFKFASQCPLNPRLMVYIPLHRDGYYLSGLTAFISIPGFVGLGLHFNSRSGTNRTVSWYGQQEGCPFHFRLRSSEVLTSISMFRSLFSPPYLGVTTNDGRSVALGPYIRPKEFYQTALFTGNVSDILGLYYETFSGSRNLASFGVLGRPGVSFHRPTLHDTTLSPPSDFGHSSLFGRSSLLNVLPPYQAMFSSLASLKDIETIDVCRLGSRCTGMLLTSGKDGHTSVLGQWYEDTSFQVEVSRLDHQLDNILAFTLVGTGQDYYVGKIDSLSASENLTDAQIFIHGARGDKIIWIYSHSSDTILLVKG